MLHEIQSSHLRAVGYDADRQVLTVQFGGGEVYDYLHVPRRVYEDLLAYQPHPWTAMGPTVKCYPYVRRGRAA